MASLLICETGEENEIAQILNLQSNISAIEAIRKRMGTGPSLFNCEECDDEIPEGRRLAVAGCRFCVYCQEAHERKR
jgi:phage/conjugal plasmid C-4 type zinc finger TraR family protein